MDAFSEVDFFGVFRDGRALAICAQRSLADTLARSLQGEVRRVPLLEGLAEPGTAPVDAAPAFRLPPLPPKPRAPRADFVIPTRPRRAPGRQYRTDDEAVTFGNAYCKAETERAILVEADDLDQTWFPKRVICPESDVHEQHDHGDLTVKRWFCEKEGII